MEWLQNNVWIFVLVSIALIVITLVIAVVLIFKVNVISHNTIDSSLLMTADIMYESNTGKEYLSFTVFNTNFRDISIRDFGLDYRNQHFNFINEYMLENKLSSLPLISARTSFNFRVDPQRLEKFILSHNYKSKNISNIFNVVVDSVGNTFTKKNVSLTHILSTRQKERIRQAKITMHNKKVEEYQKYHEDRLPLSHSVWKIFHRSYVIDPQIFELANSFDDTRLFSYKSLTTVDKAEEKVSPDSTITPTTSGEIKLTYLAPETKIKKKKILSDVSGKTSVAPVLDSVALPEQIKEPKAEDKQGDQPSKETAKAKEPKVKSAKVTAEKKALKK